MKKIIYSPGEPSGIGPDIIIKLCCSNSWEKYKSSIVSIGDPELFTRRAKLLKKKLKIIEANSLEDLKKNKKNILQIIKVSKCKNYQAGELSANNAKYVIDNLDYAIDQTLNMDKVALVTGPISKENITSIIKNFSGHTEYIMQNTKSKDVLMMLASPKLKVALATTHVPLKKVSKMIKKELIVNKIKILNNELKNKFNINKPKIRILGLNPHAGENGKIGTEELDHIKPAVRFLKKNNIDVSYPISADTAFSIGLLKDTDAYLGMYHDQVLPVLKALSFGNSINITLGIPIIRTSVDHGVALDIAGTSKSNTSSLDLAIKTAIRLTK